MNEEKRLRRAAGLTQFALARKARVPKSKIADVETGRGQYTDAERDRVFAVLRQFIAENLKALVPSTTDDHDN
jgi:transcriptional regulator with XRE-family HTH domain